MNRVLKLMDACALSEQGAIIIHKPSNVFYLSGFTGEGLLVITRNLKAIVTDFRYVEQAGAQATGFGVYSISNGVSHAQVAKGLLAGTITSALFEEDAVTVLDARKLQEALGSVKLAVLDAQTEKMRRIKDKGEIALIQKACDISCRAFDFICGEIKQGMTEKEIKLKLDFQLLALGADELAFHSIVASGPNGSLPHAIPGSRLVQKGDLITLDFGAKVGGYCADMTRTVAVGKPSDEMVSIYGIVLEAQMAAQEALAPGKSCRDMDAIARKMIAKAGFGERFGHGLGHAVGIDIHENPRLSPSSEDVLKAGVVITVEPGIYVPGIGGVRIENTCVITKDGARSLISSPRELFVL